MIFTNSNRIFSKRNIPFLLELHNTGLCMERQILLCLVGLNINTDTPLGKQFCHLSQKAAKYDASLRK